MHWRISPSLIVEPSLLVEVLEERLVGFASPEVHICNFKVAPDYKASDQHDADSVAGKDLQ